MTLREIAEKKLYFRYGTSLVYGTSFWYVDKEQPDPEREVVIRDGDCGEVRPTSTISREEFDQRVRDYGLWRSVGLWSFVPADDLAVSAIRYTNAYPDSAGRELHRLRERLRRLDWVMTLYDLALARRDEAWVELTHPGQWEEDPEDRATYEAAIHRVQRIRGWLPNPDVVE
jgi:hypothetical protein